MTSCTYYVHDFSKFDEQKFINDFYTIDWSYIHYDKTDLDKKNNDFPAKVLLVFNRMLPSRRYLKGD